MAELGSSPVADFSKVSEIGLRFQAQAQQRSAVAHQNLVNAYEKSNQQLQEAKQQMMMLPPDVAAEFSVNVEKALNARAESIMSGSAGAVNMSTGDFADIAISAAKVSTVYKDLVNKYEKVRQSDQYAQNKAAYDEWYNISTETIKVQSAQGLDGAAQLDFFQPPVLQPDMDILAVQVPKFKGKFNPSQYINQYSTEKGQGVSFREKEAATAASGYIRGEYTNDTKVESDVDYQAAFRLNPEAKPEEVMAQVNEYKQIEDELSLQGIKTQQDIEKIDNISASEKRRLQRGLSFLTSREEVFNDLTTGLVNSIRIDEQFTAYKSTGGEDKSTDFGHSFGMADDMSFDDKALQAAGYTAGQRFGYASTKNGSRRQYGSGNRMRYYEGIVFDGKEYKAVTYKPTPSFIAQLASNVEMGTQDIESQLLDPNKFYQSIEPINKIKGDIPSGEFSVMVSLAEQEYKAGLARIANGGN
jgi:uncharacterized protein YrrD